MSRDIEESLQVLRFQLNFLEQGGFERLAGGKPGASPFRDTPSCLNFDDPLRPHACRECVLYDFVPEKGRTEDVPCHSIPLDEEGHTIAMLLKEGRRDEVGSALKGWIRRTIATLEEERASAALGHDRL